ncbi:MAG TPA: sensor histidine kinase [Acidimicrobiia bacterium]|nr:sensor histidine kinase [Acidimicrobiia bacterium]
MTPIGVTVRRLLCFGVVTFGVTTAVVGATQGAPTRFLVLDTLFGLAFVVAGIVAWERRPEVPFGAMLVLCGALWWVGSYAPSGLMPYSLIGFTFERYYDIVLALIVLTFPGLALSRSGKLAMTLLVVGFVSRSAGRLLVGCECMPNPLALVNDQGLFDGVQMATTFLILVGALIVAGLALLRRRSAGSAARDVLQPVLIAGTVAALVAAWDAADLMLWILTGQGLVRLEEPWAEIMSWTIIAAVAMVPLGYLVGVLRLRTRSGPLTSLALEIDRRPPLGSLEEEVRRALGDDSASLVSWDQRARAWVDRDGRSVPPPEPDGIRGVVSIESGQRQLGFLIHDRALAEDPKLMAAITSLLRLVLENERLADEARDSLEEVRASRRRLVEASAMERRRIERDLHDGAQQRLIAVGLALQQAQEEARRHDPDTSLARLLNDTAEELQVAIDELRELARGIHPAVLTEEGLEMAISSLARRSSIPVATHVQVPARLPTSVETTAYYVIAEAMTNITRHSGARSGNISVVRSNGAVHIEVRDDGHGGADPAVGSGLRGLMDRIDAISGTLVIDSPPGRGTVLRVDIPCE